MRPRGITVDTDAFCTAMDAQRADARKAWKGSGEAKTDTIWFEMRDTRGARNSSAMTRKHAEGIVTAIVVDGAAVERLGAGQTGCAVVNQTPFYAESGGQSGDHGMITTGDWHVFRVTDTQKRVGDLLCACGRC